MTKYMKRIENVVRKKEKEEKERVIGSVFNEKEVKSIFTEKKSKTGGIHPSVSFGGKPSRKGWRKESLSFTKG